MKKISEIMKELGFDPEKPEGAQKAFIKSLLKTASEQSPRTNKYQDNVLYLSNKKDKLKSEKKDISRKNKPGSTYKQLAFDLDSINHLEYKKK